LKVVKFDQNINAGENRIAALKRERDSILAQLFGVRQPALAFAQA